MFDTNIGVDQRPVLQLIANWRAKTERSSATTKPEAANNCEALSLA
jgi:hypothetical protein